MVMFYSFTVSAKTFTCRSDVVRQWISVRSITIAGKAIDRLYVDP